MRILSISLDRTILDPDSAAAKRQIAAYVGHEAVIVIVTPGVAKELELAPTCAEASVDRPGIRVKTFGGASKFGAMMQAHSHLCRAERADVVTAQEPIYTGSVAFLVSRRMKCGLHIQDHSGMFARPAFGVRERLLRPVAKYVLRRADRVRTVSERGKRDLIAIGIPASKIDVIPIATDVSRFASVDRSRVMPNQILCVARLEKEKGIGVLLSAFHLLHTKHSETSLVIVGDGSERATLEKLARSLRIGDAVMFAGVQPDVMPYLARAGVYVQPSYFEGWGLAVIEAAAAGLPIVMTDVGCAGEIIKDGESGLVVSPGNMKALAEAMERVLNDAALRRTLGEAAQRAVAPLPGPDATAEAIRRSLEASLKNSL